MLFRKLALISVAVFLIEIGAITQCIMALMCVFVAFYLQVHMNCSSNPRFSSQLGLLPQVKYSPALNPLLNRLEECSLASNILSFALGLFLFAGAEEWSDSDNLGSRSWPEPCSVSLSRDTE